MTKFIVGVLLLISWQLNADMGSFKSANTNFKNLFNNYRIGGPATAPWVGSWWAYKNNGIDYGAPENPRSTEKVVSPSKKFDKFHKIKDGTTSSWEKKNHTCDNLKTEKQKKSCQGWWGHCNAWAAAAIKENEPRKSFVKKGIKFNIADQKALMSELYMENYSLFVGNTDKSVETDNEWIFDKNHKKSKKIINRRNYTAYDGFWDVTPKAFFLILTNYLGMQKVGVVIDRFTGDQVWNQPLAGYRLLPIAKSNIKYPKVKNGKKVYPVLLKANIYWAEDGVWEHEISDPFNYEKDTNDNFMIGDFAVSHHYKGRSLAFYLYFDAPVTVTSDGKLIKSAGRIVGDGIWYHQTKSGKSVYLKNNINFNDTHPDFIWFPTKVNDQSGRNYRNPEVNSTKVSAIMKVGEEPIPPPPANNQNFSCTYELRGFFGNRRKVFKIENSISYNAACTEAAAKCKNDIRGWQKCRRVR